MQSNMSLQTPGVWWWLVAPLSYARNRFAGTYYHPIIGRYRTLSVAYLLRLRYCSNIGVNKTQQVRVSGGYGDGA